MTFWLSKKALPSFVSAKEFDKWRNIWLVVVAVAFLSSNMWIFSGLLILACIILNVGNITDRTIYYLLIICALPQLQATIPGTMGVNFIFHLTYPRLLVLSLFFVFIIRQYLVPFFSSKRSNDKLHHFSLPTDKYVFLYAGLIAYLNFRDNTTTNALRELFMLLLDIVIPYYIISRAAITTEQMNKILFAIFIGFMPLAVIGIFETAKHWNLYQAASLEIAGPGNAISQFYDMRAGSLRASGPFSSPIVFGYILVIAFGLLLYLKPFLKSKKIANFAGAIIIFCLISTMARGPWVGMLILALTYILSGKSKFRSFALITLSGFVSIFALSFTSVGAKLYGLLPFVGSTRSDTVDYRERLFENAWIVFQDHPWLGSTTFLETEEMESMRQGQGIIDLVNSYIQIALPYGTVGLFLFFMIFFGLLFNCYQIIKKLPPAEKDLIRMGRSLFGILAAILLIIATASSIDYIPTLYWAMAGLVASYIHLSKTTIYAYFKKKNVQAHS
jgi:O-antigen ligase